MNYTTKKPLQTLQELTRNLKSDRYYFVSPCSAGDTYYLCAFKQVLEKQLQGKIIFVIKPTHKAVCEIYEAECIICDSVFLNTFQQSKCLENDCVVSTPTLGNLYPAHPLAVCEYRYPYKTMAEMYADFFDLPLDTKGDLPTNLPKLSESLRDKIEKIAPLDKIILFCPEAHTLPCLPHIIFKDECEKLLKLGYKIIVNIPNHKEYTRYFSDGVYDLDLSLKDAIALALACAGVISTRSGFCDIIAPHCKNLKIYSTILGWSSPLKEMNPSNPPKEISIYDSIAYKQFLRIARESLPMRLYKRYATKGFLRKLRTPFTLYFKIYLRDKVGESAHDLGDLGDDFERESMREFVKNELAKTYEYQLGLALQRACERFWCGGFLAFPFAYAKIRSQKGKTLTRISEPIL